MPAIYQVDLRAPYFPFSLATYLLTEVTPLNDIIPSKVERSTTRKETLKEARLIESRRAKIINTIEKYKAVIDHFGGEATARQIASYLGYSQISMPSTLRKLIKNTNMIKVRSIPMAEAKAKGLGAGRGRTQFIWSYDKDGIIFPLKRPKSY